MNKNLLHCDPVQGQNRARTGFSLCSNSHREKPVFITGNPSSHCRDPVFITGNSLWELQHREIPVVITGNGFAVWLFRFSLSKKNFCTNISFSSSNTQFYESRIFCLFTFWVFFPDKVLNYYQNTPKNVNITCYIKKKKTLCNTLNWGNWNSGFVKLGVRWAERDTTFKIRH